MILKKDALKPGLFRKGENRYLVSEHDIDAIVATVPQIKEAGYRVPIYVEHPSTKDRLAFPIKTSNAALVAEVENDPYFHGWLDSVELDENKGLHLNMDVDDGFGSKLAKKGTFVSPQFGRWKDDEGKVWDMALHHVSVVRNPVNKNQSAKFEKTAVDGHLVSGGESTPVQMSLLEAIESGTEVFVFGINDMDGSQPGSPNPTTDGNSPAGTNPDEQGIQRVLQALQALGITIAPDSPLAHDLGALSDMLSSAGRANESASKKALTSASAGNNPNTQEQAAVIAMSQNTPATPAPAATPAVGQDETRIAQMSQALLAQDAQIKALVGIASSAKKSGYMSRIDALVKSGRLTPAASEKLKTEVGTFQFSMSAPDAETPLDVKLAIYEDLPAGAVLSEDQKIKQFAITETPVNQVSGFFSGNSEPERVQTEAGVDAILKELGIGSGNNAIVNAMAGLGGIGQ